MTNITIKVGLNDTKKRDKGGMMELKDAIRKVLILQPRTGVVKEDDQTEIRDDFKIFALAQLGIEWLLYHQHIEDANDGQIIFDKSFRSAINQSDSKLTELSGESEC